QYRIERGDGASAADAVPRTLNQRRELGEDRRWVTFGRGRLADGQRNLTLRHRVAGQGVHNQQHVLAPVAEIFRATRGVGGTLHTQQRRHVRRGGDHHRAGATLRTKNVFDEIFDFATTLTNQADDDRSEEHT